MLLAYIKAFHVIAIIAWMAGLLYLPRLFVYHATSEPGSEQSKTFKVMERRLLRYITTPAMLASWALGLILAFSGLIDWSRDGTSLALAAALGHANMMTIYTFDLATQKLRPIVGDETADYGSPRFTPNGKALFVSRAADGEQ